MSDELNVVSTPEVESSPVSELTPTVEQEPTAVEPETTEVATSEQPGEDKAEGLRAAERIRRLAREKKAAEEQAAYWKTLAELQKKPEPPTYQPTDSDSEYATVDQIAKAAGEQVVYHLEAKELNKRAAEAKAQLQADIEGAIETYPELETDDELAQEVHAIAIGMGITYQAAANRVIGRRDQAAKVAEARAIATDANRASVSTPEPRGSVEVSSDIIVLSSLSDQERKDRWPEIMQAAQEGRLR